MGFTMKIDRLKEVTKAIAGMAKKQVLVGVPDSGADRDDTSGPINNAAIGYIQETGSPEVNIPARPHLVPGIEAAQPKTLPQLQKAAEAALDGDIDAAERRMGAAGMAAMSSVKRLIDAGISPALSNATLRARARRKRKGAKEELKRRADGEAPGLDLAKPLIDSAQYRNSITYVIRKRK